MSVFGVRSRIPSGLSSTQASADVPGNVAARHTGST